MIPPEIDRLIGLRVYLTKTRGIGGRIRQSSDDFAVEELISYTPFEPQDSDGIKSYTLCLLRKKNIDTLNCVRELAKRLRISEKHISFGGLKDARAMTTQYLTISGLDVTGPIVSKEFELIPLRRVSSAMSSRFLKGNRFRVVVRGIPGTPASVEQILNDTRKEIMALGGFPNFFGHQRFGTRRPVTHLVGRHMVKREFEEAVMKLLGFTTPFENPETQAARRALVEDRNFASALKFLPGNLTYERKLLEHLTAHPSDWLGALKRLPVRLLRLFTNAFQSYLFNETLSRVLDHGTSCASAETMNVKIPLVGYRTVLSEKDPGTLLLRRVLGSEGVTPRDFYIGALERASLEGETRNALVMPSDLTFAAIQSSKGFSAADFSFSLGRGSYGTILLREFMKPENPIEAGF